MAGESHGQLLAIEQIRRITDIEKSAVRAAAPVMRRGRWCAVEISMDVTGPSPEHPGDPETVIVEIPDDFPLRTPEAHVNHRRFAGLPHILWGKYICLYLSENDWDPADGMFGYLERLADWFVRAANGTLEEVGQPVHPPLSYPSSDAGSVMIPVDFPEVSAGTAWTGMAALTLAAKDRAEIVMWLPLNVVEAGQESELAGIRQMLEATAWRRRQTTLLGPVIVLPEPLTFEFPRTVGELVRALEGQGISREETFDLMLRALEINADLSSDVGAPPLYVIIGAPMRGSAGAGLRQTHLAVWRLAPEAVLRLLRSLLLDTLSRRARPESVGTLAASKQPLAWTVVYEQRPQVTVRRDSERPAGWLRGKSVLVLGCGALGARIAEHCVRAGVVRLQLADQGAVSPGILVRQPYVSDDIGLPKATALARRLTAVNADLRVTTTVGDLLRTLLTDSQSPPEFELIVDATASRSVSARIESLRRRSREWPPILTVGVGHTCERAIASVALPEATGAGADIMHNFSLAAMGRADLTDFADDFFPDAGWRRPFQPEPGCSDATFQGSDAEAAALAGQMFTWALQVLQVHSRGWYSPPKSLLAARVPGLANAGSGYELLDWQNDLTLDDADHDYQIRFLPSVIDAIRMEALTTAQLEGELVETGGMLLGRIDDACRVIWMSAATSPTADSERAQHYFRHGLAGVGGIIADHDAKSRGRERFVGMWHTHPSIEPVPSRRDLAAMDTLLVPVRDAPYRGVLAIFGGRGPLWSDWLHGRGKPTAYAGLYLTSPQQPRVPFVMPLRPTIGTRPTSRLPTQIGECARRSGQPGTRASDGCACQYALMN
jgi:hypothetical protein